MNEQHTERAIRALEKMDFYQEKEKKLLTQVSLLELEVACLRSVLSEWEHDKSCFIQMTRADDLRRVIEEII